MKEYIKPALEVVELRVKENIANTNAPTTVYKKGTNGWTKSQLLSVAQGTFDKQSLSQ